MRPQPRGEAELDADTEWDEDWPADDDGDWSGCRPQRLQHLLQRKQARWANAAQACGLMRAQEREEALFRAVRAAADSLYIVPATTLPGLMLKLAVLLSLEEPGGIERDVPPWRDLRLILLDLSAIATAAIADR